MRREITLGCMIWISRRSSASLVPCRALKGKHGTSLRRFLSFVIGDRTNRHMWEVRRTCYSTVSTDASTKLRSESSGDSESNGSRRTSGDRLPDGGPAAMPTMSPSHDHHRPAIPGIFDLSTSWIAVVDYSHHRMVYGRCHDHDRNCPKVSSERKSSLSMPKLQFFE